MPQKTVKSFKIPKEVLKQIGDKVTQKVMHKIDKIISEKCREIIGATNLASANDQDVKRDINELKTSWGKIQANLANPSEKTDRMLGSLTYIASEYDYFGTIISKISKEHNLLSQDVIHLQDAVAQSNKLLPMFSRGQWRGNVFWTGGLEIVRSCQRLGGFAPQTPLFSNARF